MVMESINNDEFIAIIRRCSKWMMGKEYKTVKETLFAPA